MEQTQLLRFDHRFCELDIIERTLGREIVINSPSYICTIRYNNHVTMVCVYGHSNCTIKLAHW